MTLGNDGWVVGESFEMALLKTKEPTATEPEKKGGKDGGGRSGWD